uniref:Tenascin-X n=1 Tax=Trichuris muris TaxID=70415 RepID=A0A5S6QXB7_TRIMR
MTINNSALLLLWVTATTSASSGIGDTCSKTEDCSDQMICANKYCMLAEPVGTNCISSSQCSINESCRYGLCWKVYYAKCATDTECPSPLHCRFGYCDVGKDPVCAKHTDCADQEICMRGKCRTGIPSSKRCNSNVNCGGDMACRHGVCWQVKDDGCQVHSDCKDQHLCFRGRCNPGVPTDKRCESDRQCSPGEGCIHGICWRVTALGKTCKTHSDCPDMMFCVSQHCRAGVATAKTCMGHKNCLSNEACKHGICWKLQTAESKCARHQECGDQSLCLNGRCKVAVPTYEVCDSNGRCSDGGVCRYDICWKEAEKEARHSCDNHNDCDDSFICLNRRCEEGWPSNRRCSGDRQCYLNEICHRSICWKRKEEQSVECKEHLDCRGQKLCVENKCTNARFVEKLCNADRDCDANQGCKYGTCWAV